MNSKRFTFTVLLVVLTLGGAAAFLAWKHLERRWTESTMAASQLAGAAVVSQLEAYRESVGQYPEGLDQLNVLVPAPAAGLGVWEYRRVGDGFELRVNGAPSGYPSMTWQSGTAEWIVDM